MPLPQQIVEQLSRDTGRTPGWSSGVILFAVSICGIVVLMYAGLTFGYEPYLNGQISNAQSQITVLGQKISPADEAQLVSYYSQITNLQGLIGKHVIFSGFLAWLGSRTDVNVYYTGFTFNSGNQVALTAVAKTPTDIPAQVAVFESDPNVQGVSVSDIAPSSAGGWNFDIILSMSPSIFSWPSTTGSSTATTTTP